MLASIREGRRDAISRPIATLQRGDPTVRGRDAMPKNHVRTVVGNRGETHQQAGDETQMLTTNHGVPVSDNQNSLRRRARSDPA